MLKNKIKHPGPGSIGEASRIVTMRLPLILLEKLDERAAKEGTRRSALVRELLANAVR